MRSLDMARKLNRIAENMKAPETEGTTRIDWQCLTERERQQTKNLQTLKQAVKNALKTEKQKRSKPNIQQTSKNPKKTLPKAESQSRPKTPKPKATSNPLSHLQTLESNSTLPQDQRHPVRHAIPRPQKHQKHSHIRSD